MDATRVAQIQRELTALGDVSGWHSVEFGPLVMLILNAKHSMTLGSTERPACPDCHAIGGFIGDAPHAVRELLADNRAAYGLLQRIIEDAETDLETTNHHLFKRISELLAGGEEAQHGK